MLSYIFGRLLDCSLTYIMFLKNGTPTEFDDLCTDKSLLSSILGVVFDAAVRVFIGMWWFLVEESFLGFVFDAVVRIFIGM